MKTQITSLALLAMASLNLMAETPQNLLYAAEAALEEGRSQEARTAFKRILSQDPENLIAKVRLAQLTDQTPADQVRQTKTLLEKTTLPSVEFRRLSLDEGLAKVSALIEIASDGLLTPKFKIDPELAAATTRETFSFYEKNSSAGEVLNSFLSKVGAEASFTGNSITLALPSPTLSQSN